MLKNYARCMVDRQYKVDWYDILTFLSLGQVWKRTEVTCTYLAQFHTKTCTKLWGNFKEIQCCGNYVHLLWEISRNFSSCICVVSKMSICVVSKMSSFSSSYQMIEWHNHCTPTRTQGDYSAVTLYSSIWLLELLQSKHFS